MADLHTEPFDLSSAHVHLGRDSTAIVIPDFQWTPELLDAYTERFVEDGAKAHGLRLRTAGDAEAVMRRPVVIDAAAIIFLVVLGSPFLRVNFGSRARRRCPPAPSHGPCRRACCATSMATAATRSRSSATASAILRGGPGTSAPSRPRSPR